MQCVKILTSLFGLHVLMVTSVVSPAYANNLTIKEGLSVSPHDPNVMQPFGTPNPKRADEESRIFDTFIGTFSCSQERTDKTSGKVVKANSIWAWYYNMNGFGIRDEYRFNQSAPVSQRIYDPMKKEWHVWYFLGEGRYYAGEWVGGRKKDRLVFDMKDDEGRLISRLQFYDITPTEYKWKSADIDAETNEEFIDWTIRCEKVRA